MSKFLDVSVAVQEASKGYGDIDESMHEIFLESFKTFLGIVNELQNGSYTNITSQQVKISVFENVFDIDLRKTVLKLVEEGLKQRDGNAEDTNELNADEDLLASIRKNFDEYLKD